MKKVGIILREWRADLNNMLFYGVKTDYCDGIIFPGGKYVRKIDMEIMKYLYDINKPTLGICLGMQVMGETFNGGKREKIEKRKS